MFFKSNRDASDVTAKAERKRRFWKKARRRTLWGLAIFIVAHTTLNLYSSVLLNREIAEIRQKGEPVMFAEMAPPPIPDSQNAASLYRKASDTLKFTPEEKVALNTRLRRRTPRMNAVVEAGLRKNRDALALARKAAAMPECQFPIDWQGDPVVIRFEHYGKLRELARLMADQARIDAKNGQTSAALLNVRSIFLAANHLSNEPLYIGFLVGVAIDGIAHYSLAEVLEKVPLTPSQARDFEAMLPKTDWAQALRRSMIGERTMSSSVFFRIGAAAYQAKEQLSENPDFAYTLLTNLSKPLLWIYRPILKIDQVYSLRLWKQLIDAPATQKPSSAAAAFDAQLQRTPRYAMLTRILLPAFGRADENRLRSEVRRHQREVALALNCYRTVKGEYPQRLKQVEAFWKAPLPQDIYSRQPFIYRRENKGFLLYSVGVNRIDDGGKGSSGFPVTSPKFDQDDLLWGGPRQRITP